MNSNSSTPKIPEYTSDNTEWPWTSENSPNKSDTVCSNDDLKISLIIISYNQGEYLEEAIRSALLQNYSNLELVIIDGGSSDQSVDIIKKYDQWINYWVSESDDGQTDAINKGFAKCTGDIVNWLCSDDLLMPNALNTVAMAFQSSSDIGVVLGHCFCKYQHEPDKSELLKSDALTAQKIPYADVVWQPSCFFKKKLITRANLVRLEMNYAMDRELWCHLTHNGAIWKQSEETLSINRFTGDNKSLSGQSKIISELDAIYRLYSKDWIPLTAILKTLWAPLIKIQTHHSSKIAKSSARLISKAITATLIVFYPRENIRVLQKDFFRYSI